MEYVYIISISVVYVTESGISACLSLALADNERDEYTYIHQNGWRAMMESIVLARIWRCKNAYAQLVRYPSQHLIFSIFFTWAILVCVSLIYLICID